LVIAPKAVLTDRRARNQALLDLLGSH
jgi:hypothetical protein